MVSRNNFKLTFNYANMKCIQLRKYFILLFKSEKLFGLQIFVYLINGEVRKCVFDYIWQFLETLRPEKRK